MQVHVNGLVIIKRFYIDLILWPFSASSPNSPYLILMNMTCRALKNPQLYVLTSVVKMSRKSNCSISRSIFTTANVP